MSTLNRMIVSHSTTSVFCARSLSMAITILKQEDHFPKEATPLTVAEKLFVSPAATISHLQYLGGEWDNP